MQTGFIPNEGFNGIYGGMCAIRLFKTEEFKLFVPQNFEELGPYHATFPDGGYWAYDGYETCADNFTERRLQFSPLRQNIVLFLAAMNGEL